MVHTSPISLKTVRMPLQMERATVQEAVQSVSRVAKLLWPHSRTVLFGSQATDLALPGSDMDIVILGVAQDLTTAASGFTRCVLGIAAQVVQMLTGPACAKGTYHHAYLALIAAHVVTFLAAARDLALYFIVCMPCSGW